MIRRAVNAALLGGLALLAGACATSGEWAEWRQHQTHFASGEHATFSLRNRGTAGTRVTRADLDRSRTEAWWGQPVTVGNDQILQN